MNEFWFVDGGFVPNRNDIPPSDNAVKISKDYHTYLGIEQAKGNKIVVPDDGSVPYIEKKTKESSDITKKQDIRTRRDIELNKTDWTQLPDIEPKKRKAYASYRQKLRDIPQQDGFPEKVNWPVKPE